MARDTIAGLRLKINALEIDLADAIARAAEGVTHRAESLNRIRDLEALVRDSQKRASDIAEERERALDSANACGQALRDVTSDLIEAHRRRLAGDTDLGPARS